MMVPQHSTAQNRILGDSWYAASVEGLCIVLENEVAAASPKWLHWVASGSGLMRAIFFFKLAGNYDYILTALRLPSSRLLIFLEALFGRRRLILLEFMPAPAAKSGLRRVVDRVSLFFLSKALQRSLYAAHVLTESERELYAAQFALPQNLFFCLPWPMRRSSDSMPDFSSRNARLVVSSGRMFCDWQTLLEAAEGQDWNLLIICAGHDYERIKSHLHGPNVTILTAVSIEAHQDYLSQASVYVISLSEAFISSGQIRVMNAVRAGVPIVATSVLGLEGYIKDGETALMTPPGDWMAMRNAVNLLLAHPEKGRGLALKAWESAEGKTFENYKIQIKLCVHNRLSRI